MAISYVGVSTMWSSSASSTSFTINKPAGSLTDGDLMIAVLAWSTGATDTDLGVTAPSGWTKQDEVFNAGDGWDSQLCVMTKAYASGDPSSWSGTLSSTSAKIKVSAVSAYRGVQSILAKGTSSAAYGTTSYSTATVNNTVANSWRFTTACYESGSLTYSMNTNEASSRALVGDVNSGTNDNVQLRLADSNAAVATGNHSRTCSRSQNWDASCSWIAILREATGTAATGTVGITLGRVSAAFDATAEDPATMAMTLGHVSAAMDGYGQPPVVSGTATMQLGGVSEAFAAGVPPMGSMTMANLCSIAFSVETRVFGIRVISIDADDRSITVPSRGVDD